MSDGIRCGWRVKGRARCGLPASAVRDLGPSYGALRRQHVCPVHAQLADTTRPRPLEPPEPVPDEPA